jgi:hypothetical protein
MTELGGFTDHLLSSLAFADGPVGVSYLNVLALQNGF